MELRLATVREKGIAFCSKQNAHAFMYDYMHAAGESVPHKHTPPALQNSRAKGPCKNS